MENVLYIEFQSTGTMQGSGSVYASNPSLNSDGTATYNEPSYAPSRVGHTISGPHYIPPVTPSGDPTPIGGEWLPLMLMVGVYGLGRWFRRWRFQR